MADCTEGIVSNSYDSRELAWKPAVTCESCGSEQKAGICDRAYTLGDKCDLFDFTADARTINQTEKIYKRVGGKWVLCGSIPQPPEDQALTFTRSAKACGISLWDTNPPKFTLYDIWKNCGKVCKVNVFPQVSIGSLPGTSLSATSPEELTMEWGATVDGTTYWIAAESTAAMTIPAAASASPVVSVAYGSSANCDTSYALHANRSVTYSVNGAAAVNVVIGAALAADTPRWIKVVGNTLVAGFATGHYYTTLTDGVPGATWTRVAYAAAITNNSRSYVDASGRLWETTGAATTVGVVNAVGQAASTIATPSQTMNDVSGCGNTVVFGGTAMTMFRTSNGGRSFTQVPFTLPAGSTALAAGASITAIEQVDKNTIKIGTSDGRVFATCTVNNAVPTWVESTLPTDASAGTAITDLVQATDEVGYVSRGNQIYRTIGGFRSDNLPSTLNWGSTDLLTYVPGTVTAINEIAVPTTGAFDRMANNFLAAATAGAAGAVVVGSVAGGVTLS